MHCLNEKCEFVYSERIRFVPEGNEDLQWKNLVQTHFFQINFSRTYHLILGIVFKYRSSSASRN